MLNKNNFEKQPNYNVHIFSVFSVFFFQTELQTNTEKIKALEIVSCNFHLVNATLKHKRKINETSQRFMNLNNTFPCFMKNSASFW